MRCRLFAVACLSVITLAQQAPPPAQVATRTTIAPKGEPGERLVLKGTLFAADGATLPHVKIYAYHTDSAGVYSRPVNDSRNPRLQGWVKTDDQGRFELDTIRPAPYPGGGNPAHVHVVLWVDGREAGHDECWFEGDTNLTSEMKQREQAAGKFTRIVKLTNAGDGVWRGQWNLKLRR
jgi:protocatechuate 3,4-dioxygenase, beta subunit